MELFTAGRVLIERQPESMAGYQTGRVSDARQPLAENEQLRSFFLNEKVLTAAGGISGLDYWLLKYGGGHCQYAHSDYHYHELTIMHHEPGSILLCGYCDNHLREQHTEALAELACRNVIAFVLDSVRISLAIDKSREISSLNSAGGQFVKGLRMHFQNHAFVKRFVYLKKARLVAKAILRLQYRPPASSGN
jgi:hypothetical protein